MDYITVQITNLDKEIFNLGAKMNSNRAMRKKDKYAYNRHKSDKKALDGDLVNTNNI